MTTSSQKRAIRRRMQEMNITAEQALAELAAMAKQQLVNSGGAKGNLASGNRTVTASGKMRTELTERYPNYWALLQTVPDATLAMMGGSAAECPLLDCLEEFASSNKLLNLKSVFEERAMALNAGESPLGNCQAVTEALVQDAYDAGLKKGWLQVRGIVEFAPGKPIDHFWVRADGWVVDNADGKCVVAKADDYDCFVRGNVTFREGPDQ